MITDNDRIIVYDDHFALILLSPVGYRLTMTRSIHS